MCKISRSESQKRRGHSPGNEFGVFHVNQPVVMRTGYSNGWGVADAFDALASTVSTVAFSSPDRGGASNDAFEGGASR